jgi:hypothetical protein
MVICIKYDQFIFVHGKNSRLSSSANLAANSPQVSATALIEAVADVVTNNSKDNTRMI